MAATLFCTLALVACGGSGGGSDSGGGNAVSYNGLTSQAEIDQNNAQTLSFEAYAGGSEPTDLEGINPLFAAQATNSTGAIPDVDMPALAKTMKDILLSMEPQASGSTPVAAMVPVDTITMDGDCDGRATGSISIDTVTGALSASFTFTNYQGYGEGFVCDGTGEMLSGKVKMLMEIDVDNPDAMGTMTMEFAPLTIVQGTDDLTLSGSIEVVELDIDTEQVTTNIVIRDNTLEKTFKIQDFVIQITNFGTYAEENILSGRFYNPDFGYVDISTPVAPIRTNFGDDHPSAGELYCAGSNGSEVTVTFNATGATGAGRDTTGGTFTFDYTYPAP